MEDRYYEKQMKILDKGYVAEYECEGEKCGCELFEYARGVAVLKKGVVIVRSAIVRGGSTSVCRRILR